MNRNLITYNREQFNKDLAILKNMNNFVEISSNKEENSIRGSFYENLKNRAGKLMEIITGKKAINPLNKEDIKEFNIALQKKVFLNEENNSEKTGDSDDAIFDKVRELIFNSYKLYNIPQELLDEEMAESGNFSQAINNYKSFIENESVQYVLYILDDKNKKITKNIFDDLQSQDKNYLIQKKTKDTMSFESGDVSFNLIFSPSYIKKIVRRIYDLDKKFLFGYTKQTGMRKTVADIAYNFLENNKDIIIKEMEKTLITYNTSIFSKVGRSFSSFKGFYGEAMTGVLLKKMNGNTEIEQVGANKKFQKTTNKKKLEYLKQTPTDVLAKIDGVTYRFQVKQWTNESLKVHKNEKNELVGGLGRTSIEYIGNESKDLRYFYDMGEIEIIRRLIEAPACFKKEEVENQDYLENNPNLFQHLAFGALRIETFLPYINKYVSGNDFFSIRGYLIPSVYFIKAFLEQVNDEKKQSGLITIDTVENNNLENFHNHRPLDSFKVNVRGLSVNIKGLDIF